MQIDPKSLADFITAAKFLKLNGFNDIDPNIDIDEISMVNKQTPKKSFLLKLKRCDPAPTQDQQTNNNGGNSTSTMNEENGKFLPSSESDESDGIDKLLLTFFFSMIKHFCYRSIRVL